MAEIRAQRSKLPVAGTQRLKQARRYKVRLPPLERLRRRRPNSSARKPKSRLNDSRNRPGNSVNKLNSGANSKASSKTSSNKNNKGTSGRP